MTVTRSAISGHMIQWCAEGGYGIKSGCSSSTWLESRALLSCEEPEFHVEHTKGDSHRICFTWNKWREKGTVTRIIKILRHIELVGIEQRKGIGLSRGMHRELTGDVE